MNFNIAMETPCLAKAIGRPLSEKGLLPPIIWGFHLAWPLSIVAWVGRLDRRTETWSGLMKRVVTGALAAVALSVALPFGTAQAAPIPVADSGSSSIGCTSTDINPCAIRPLLDLLVLLSTGSASGGQ